MGWFGVAGASAARVAMKRSYVARHCQGRCFFRSSSALLNGTTNREDPNNPTMVQESMRLLKLVRAYQVNGHLKAKLHPLGLEDNTRVIPRDLDPALYGFTEADLDREFLFGEGFLSENRSLRSILARLEQAYCGSIGYEYMHIADEEKLNWLRDKIETPTKSDRQVMHTLSRLTWSTRFENLTSTVTNNAHFHLNGPETLIPGMEGILDRASELGVDNIVLGMPRRGLPSVLGTVFRAFTSSHEVAKDSLYTAAGDFNYQLGPSCDRPTRGGKRIHLSLVSDHSSLQAPHSLVLGMTRAKQYCSNDADRTKNMAVLIHGDISFAGQGVLYETLHLSALPNCTIGGTIHVILNDQVTFRTVPRPSLYCTDVAKALGAPIFHVNGDNVEAVVRACELAVEWRQTFRSDVVVDLMHYRRFFDDEIDQPRPKISQFIQNHPSALEMYQKKLLESGQVSDQDIKKMNEKVNSANAEDFLRINKKNNSVHFVPVHEYGRHREIFGSPYTGFHTSGFQTGVKHEILKNVGKVITALPDKFKPHRGVKKVNDARARMIESGKGIDWGLAEALAFATLLEEGTHVRLSGQDVERGRVVHDQETGDRYCPLDHVTVNQDEEILAVSNSSLSEFGALGFELGYSIGNPNALVVWEAQFGDFANWTRPVFDKFLKTARLVVLLPYGDDGLGPQYSSARWDPFFPEELIKPITASRWQVVYVTTPANYFHVLRRQMRGNFGKPLIVMTPKNLEEGGSFSNLSEFESIDNDDVDAGFQSLIKDQNQHSDLEEGIRRLVLCSGKIYYDLDQERKRVRATDVAICRVEELYPFPYHLVERELKRYPNAEIVWCQEEPKNMGAYNHISPLLSTMMKALGRGSLKYVGRSPSPPSSTRGTHFSSEVYTGYQKHVVENAMQPEPIPPPHFY